MNTDMRLELSAAESMESWDWEYIFGHFMEPSPVFGSSAQLTSFDRSDVEEIIGIVEGENDGPDWVGVFRLRDGRFASVTAGCDYTGWG